MGANWFLSTAASARQYFSNSAAADMIISAGNGSGGTRLLLGTKQGGNAVVIDGSNNMTLPAALHGPTGGKEIDASANIFAGYGTNVVYRCTVAGSQLPVGALTIEVEDCGANGAADTGLRVK